MIVSSFAYIVLWFGHGIIFLNWVSNDREAARDCRRKKKEYIKCLEHRVHVLESQNKALIDELKQLKEMYCRDEMH